MFSSTPEANGRYRASPLEFVVVVAVCGFLFFYGLGAFGLVGADEPRYAQVAREMLERDDYVTPTLNGEGWFEKPALYYWRAMFAFESTNRFLTPTWYEVHDWAARIPSATFALGMIAVIFFHMRRFRPGAQLDAALITASCAAVIGFSRGASTDMQLAAPFVVAMLGWYAWYETRKKIWLLDLYIFIAIAMLAKGPVAPFLAGAIVLVFCVLRGEWKTAFRTLWWPGIVIFLAISLPWYILVQRENPDFFRVFILEHNLSRFATDQFRHVQPFWYYLPVLMLALAPWTFIAIPALFEALRACIKDWRAVFLHRKTGVEPARTNVDAFPEFLVICALLPIIFFSLSQSKLPGYILPAIPAVTILTADYIQRRGREALSPLLIASHAALSGVLAGLFLVFPYFFLQTMVISRAGKFLVAAIAGAVFIALYSMLRWKGPSYLRAVTLVPVILIVGFILRVAAPVVDDFYSARPVARELKTLRTDFRPLAVFQVKRELRFGLAFYRNSKIYNYDAAEVPTVSHVLVARAGARDELRTLLRGRRLARLGDFPQQRVEFFLVSPAAQLEP